MVGLFVGELERDQDWNETFIIENLKTECLAKTANSTWYGVRLNEVK